MESERIAIEGMHCANCSALIEKMVGRMDGVDACAVNLAANNGTVTYDPQVTSMSEVVGTICDLGYGATVIPKERRAAFDAERHEREGAQRAHDMRIFVMSLVLTVLVMVVSMTPLGMQFVMPIANAAFGGNYHIFIAALAVINNLGCRADKVA